ncbi:hypothetical protein SxD43FB_08690 [Sphingobium sp. D43FB]|nr:hypothetical protein SxD43FB_08690 [Sphingobium sp. D43FB]
MGLGLGLTDGGGIDAARRLRQQFRQRHAGVVSDLDGSCSPAKAGVQFRAWDWTPAFAGEQ